MDLVRLARALHVSVYSSSLRSDIFPLIVRALLGVPAIGMKNQGMEYFVSSITTQRIICRVLTNAQIPRLLNLFSRSISASLTTPHSILHRQVTNIPVHLKIVKFVTRKKIA